MAAPEISDADPNGGHCWVCRRIYVRKAPGWPWETWSGTTPPIGIEATGLAPTEPPPPRSVPS
jgi:hypothetical protein